MRKSRVLPIRIGLLLVIVLTLSACVDLRVTALTVDDTTCAVTAKVENLGGSMHYDSLVRLSKNDVQFKECLWPKEVRATICRGYCLGQMDPVPLRCATPRNDKVSAQIIRNLSENVFSEAGQYRQTTLHARQDLAVERLSKDPRGRIKAFIRNRGLCDAFNFSVAAWTEGEAYTAGPTFGTLERNAQFSWYLEPQPPTGAEVVFVKVLPSQPLNELDWTNDLLAAHLDSIRSGQGHDYDLVPTDIRLFGDYDYLSPAPWVYEQSFKVVPVVRNIGNAETNGLSLKWKIYIDGVDAGGTGGCSMGLQPGEELALGASYCHTGVTIPPGEHNVQFVILTNDANVSNNSLSKTFYRP